MLISRACCCHTARVAWDDSGFTSSTGASTPLRNRPTRVAPKERMERDVSPASGSP